jgi:hypothetical protein
MILQRAMVQSYLACSSTHYKFKVHMDGYLDWDIGCTLHCKVHLELNIDIFLVKFSRLGSLRYHLQFLISFLP